MKQQQLETQVQELLQQNASLNAEIDTLLEGLDYAYEERYHLQQSVQMHEGIQADLNHRIDTLERFLSAKTGRITFLEDALAEALDTGRRDAERAMDLQEMVLDLRERLRNQFNTIATLTDRLNRRNEDD